MATLGICDSANLNGGQKLAVKYFTVAIVLFGAQILFGLLSGLQYLYPDFLYGVLDFSVNRMCISMHWWCGCCMVSSARCIGYWKKNRNMKWSDSSWAT
jgi:nitric oxide reductase large subunit